MNTRCEPSGAMAGSMSLNRPENGATSGAVQRPALRCETWTAGAGFPSPTLRLK